MKCHNCSIEHDKVSNFCSQFCFDDWFNRTQLPQIMNAIVTAIFGRRDNANDGHS